ncbi:MAG: regulator of sigma protease [Acidobacteriota bacterium]|jgi:regulator of sigma E protease|nr:regulator of sigma protease [Acidobacteriota bacterium]
MSNLPTNLIAVVIVLGSLIFIHEAGHFVMAKLFRVRVLVFSLGFGKRIFGFQRGGTDYRVSIVPLGGYVRMAGDTPEENVAGNPDEFLSKPKWQRFIILVAGPFMNILVAITFIAGLAMVGTEQFVSKPIIGEVLPNKPAARAGLQTGDRIVSIKGEPVNDFSDLRLLISMNAGTPLPIVYVRNGQTRTTVMTPDREESEFAPIGKAGIGNYYDPIVGRIDKGSPAEKAGIKVGDRIVAANGQPVNDMTAFAVLAGKDPKKPVTVEVLRNGQRIKVTMLAVTGDDAEGNLTRGIMPPTVLFKLSLIPALRHSVHENWRMLKLAGAAVARIFRAEGSVKELSGPINIARISGEMFRRGPVNFIALMAMISLQLGVMNLLPIPVLDGGHIMILIVEGIARRDLSLRVKERIQQVGFAALAMLMLVVLYNDVVGNVLRIGKG